MADAEEDQRQCQRQRRVQSGQRQGQDQQQAAERADLAQRQDEAVTVAPDQPAGQQVAEDVGDGDAHDVPAHPLRRDAVAGQHQRRAAQEGVEGGGGHGQHDHVEQEGFLARQPAVAGHQFAPATRAGAGGRTDVGQATPGGHEQHERQHRHDQQVGLPAEAHVQVAAQQRRRRRAHPHRHADEGHHAGAFAALEQVLHQRPSHHHAGGAAGALQHARQRQHAQAGRGGGHQRPGAGERQPDQQHRLATESVGQRSVEQLQAAIGGLQLLYGPLSDRFGRKPILLAGLVLACLGSILAALAPGLGVLTLARVLQGAGTAAGMVVGRAMV
ncbi:MAG: MFS transporter, partial [Comamonadaceae bacterium]